MKYYLNKNVKFRKEDQYILVCDLSVLENYKFPLQYYNEFLLLKNGLVYEFKTEFLEDLITLDLVSFKKNNLIESKVDVFSKLKYEESEFF